jgi:hypothetical protein
MRLWVLAHVLEVLPVLNEARAKEFLIAANAWSNWGLRQLRDHLYLNRGAILEGSATAPPALIRLTHALREAGHLQVTLPSCTACGLTTPTLFPSPRGNVCQRCRPRREPRICGRCGRLGTICAERPEGFICANCYRLDPLVAVPCGKCGPEAGTGCPIGGRHATVQRLPAAAQGHLHALREARRERHKDDSPRPGVPKLLSTAYTAAKGLRRLR